MTSQQASQQTGQLFTIAQAARVAQKSPTTIKKWRDDGRFPNAKRDGNGPLAAWLIPLEDLKATGWKLDLDQSDQPEVIDLRGDQPGSHPDGPPDQSAIFTPPPGQTLVPQEQWEVALSQMGRVFDLSMELSKATEAKGRAESRAEVFKERIAQERGRADRLEAELTRKRRRWWSR